MRNEMASQIDGLCQPFDEPSSTTTTNTPPVVQDPIAYHDDSATQLVVADNWGGLFDEIPSVAHEPVPAPDATSTDSAVTQLVVADNWGGLFDETPAVVHELVPTPDTTFPNPNAAASSSALVTPTPTPSWKHMEAGLSTEQQRIEEFAAMLCCEKVTKVILGSIPRVGIDRSNGPSPDPAATRTESDTAATPPRLTAALAKAAPALFALGTPSPSSKYQLPQDDLDSLLSVTPDDDVAYCVCLPTRSLAPTAVSADLLRSSLRAIAADLPVPNEEAERMVQEETCHRQEVARLNREQEQLAHERVTASMLSDTTQSSHINLAVASTIPAELIDKGRVLAALPDFLTAALVGSVTLRTVHVVPVDAMLLNASDLPPDVRQLMQLVMPDEEDAVASMLPDRCLLNCPTGSALGPAVVVFKDVAVHFQPRYTANLTHAYSVEGAAVQLCCTSSDTHVVQRVSEGMFTQNLVLLRQPWPPPIEFECLGNGVQPCLLFGFTQGVMVPKPPWPPPQSNGLLPCLYARWVNICSLSKCILRFFNCEVCGVIKGLQQVTSYGSLQVFGKAHHGLSCTSNSVVEFPLPTHRTILQSVVFCEVLLKDTSTGSQYHNCREIVLWTQLTNPWLSPIQFKIQSNDVQLRPMPWPSFSCLTIAWLSAYSVHECWIQFLCGAIIQELRQFVISFGGLIAEMRFFSSMVLLLSVFHEVIDTLVLDGPVIFACILYCCRSTRCHLIFEQPWPPPHVQIEFKCYSAAMRPLPWPSFTLSNCCFMSRVICWKPQWPLQRRQDMANTVTIVAEVYAIFLEERESVLKQVENIVGRINVALQSWATSQTHGYISPEPLLATHILCTWLGCDLIYVISLDKQLEDHGIECVPCSKAYSSVLYHTFSDTVSYI